MPLPPSSLPTTTSILSSAQRIATTSLAIHLSPSGIASAAASIHTSMQARSYSPATWSTHPLHPSAKSPSTLAFIFTMDLLNFSFWSARDDDGRYGVLYRDQVWRGYWGLVAALRRDQDEGGRVLDPSWWVEEGFTVEALGRTFRGVEGGEEMPLLKKRWEVLKEAGRVLETHFGGSVEELVRSAGGSAGRLVNILAEYFDRFRDEGVYQGEKIRFLKRAQIFVADLWAAYEGTSYGSFGDIDSITMFADYRVPQQLHALGCFTYAPGLDRAIRAKEIIPSGSDWEMQLRGCSIWTVELIRQQILADYPDAKVNAILIDFLLYDLAKEREAAGQESIPHHRTRSIWY